VSGAHAFYRTPSKPLVIGGQVVLQTPADPMDWSAIRRTLRPTRPPVWRNGKLAAFDVFYDLKPVQVLDYVEPETRPSKHRRGRMRPRTKTEQRRYRAMMAKVTQAHKTSTIDQNWLAGVETGDTAIRAPKLA
jgi:hypothetical protein